MQAVLGQQLSLQMEVTSRFPPKDTCGQTCGCRRLPTGSETAAQLRPSERSALLSSVATEMVGSWCRWEPRSYKAQVIQDVREANTWPRKDPFPRGSGRREGGVGNESLGGRERIPETGACRQERTFRFYKFTPQSNGTVNTETHVMVCTGKDARPHRLITGEGSCQLRPLCRAQGPASGDVCEEPAAAREAAGDRRSQGDTGAPAKSAKSRAERKWGGLGRHLRP